MSIPDDETRLSATGIVDQFVRDWIPSNPPDVSAYLPPVGDNHRKDVLHQLILADIQRRWPAGCGKTVEEYAAEFPELGERDEISGELILAELEARRDCEEAVGLPEIAERFPKQAVRWSSDNQVAVHSAVEPQPHPLTKDTLEEGDRVGDFRIIRLLGRGSLAKVYLAEELSLGRQVALKIAVDGHDEERLMAKLEHPNIVPIYSQSNEQGHKVIAMRYVRGATLASWMNNLADIDRRTWKGIELSCWLREVAQTTIEQAADQVMDRRRFDRQGFVQIVCRLILGIAKGLVHAHRHNILHGDIKPANIMLDMEGQAMLMDFNVASQQDGDEGGVPRGGTLGYMSPEQLQYAVPGERRDAVDGRSDVYSLGVLFYELLTGLHPWSLGENVAGVARFESALAQRMSGPPPIPSQRKRISIGLRCIVQKCLEPNPEQRYASAADLVEDLERQLSNRSLAHADDPSWLERSVKWTKRHRPLVGLGITVALLLIGGGVTADLNRAHTVLASIRECRDHLSNDTDRAAAALSAAHTNTLRGNWVLPPSWFARRYRDALVTIGELAAELAPLQQQRFDQANDAFKALAHQQAESPLRIYRVLSKPDWEDQPHVRALDPLARQRLNEDITELLVLRASTSNATDREPLWERLPSGMKSLPVLRALRTSTDISQTLHEQAAGKLIHFERYLLGSVAAQQADYEFAVEQLDQVIEAPDGQSNFWAQFVRAYCLERQGYSQSAILNYTYCAGLRPSFPWPSYNIGLIYASKRRWQAALQAFRKAIKLDSRLALAHMNVGYVLIQQRKPKDALKAFNAAIKIGNPTAQLYANRAAAYAMLGDTSSARQDLQAALAIDPNHQQAKENLRRLGR